MLEDGFVLEVDGVLVLVEDLGFVLSPLMLLNHWFIHVFVGGIGSIVLVVTLLTLNFLIQNRVSEDNWLLLITVVKIRIGVVFAQKSPPGTLIVASISLL